MQATYLKKPKQIGETYWKDNGIYQITKGLYNQREKGREYSLVSGKLDPVSNMTVTLKILFPVCLFENWLYFFLTVSLFS